KAREVAQVFHSVAQRFDVMDDLMSGGLHRLWKRSTIERAAIRPGMRVLDIAGGTGDLARAFASRVGGHGEVWLTDINSSMLAVGRDRLLDHGLVVPTAVCDAEKDRKSTRLNSSHVSISYAVFCLKKKRKTSK